MEALLLEEEVEKRAAEKGASSRKKQTKAKKASSKLPLPAPASRTPVSVSDEVAPVPAASLPGRGGLDGCGGRGGRGLAPPSQRLASAALTPAPAASTVVPLSLASLDTGRQQVPESTMGGETTCIVCFTNPKTHLAVPCGHQCACESCAAQMQKCPYCREPTMMWLLQRMV